MRSRTEGAPSLPIVSDEDVTLEQLEEARRLGAINDDQYRANLAALAVSAPAGPPPVSPATAARRARFDQEVADAERGLDEMRAGPGAPPPRVRPPSPTARLEQEGQDLADSRAYGRPSQGGAPFRSAGEAEEYGRRGLLSDAEKALMRLGPVAMTEAQIIEAQRSQRDRDMAQAGRSGSSGWAPVYAPDGSVTYMERAGSPGEMPGATDMAVGQRRVGPLVDAGQVSPSLAREDRLAQGYSPQRVDGPYGAEVVWVKDSLGEQTRQRLLREGDAEGAAMTLEEYQNRQKQRSLKRRLMDRAGVTSKDVAGADMSVQQLRDLIADTRAASERERKEVNRRARMANFPREELALRELGGPDSNEWQNAVVANRLTRGLSGMTPIARDAQSMQNMLRMMNMEAMAGMDPLNRDIKQRQLDAAERENNPTAAGQRDLRSGDYFSPEAESAVQTMAAQFDSTTGGFSDENERQLARYLQSQYSIPQPDAERLANVAANKRRRAWLQQPPVGDMNPPPAVGPAPAPRPSGGRDMF